jgi:ADP-ribosyl-[dinitrogen reductase] hydrolase
MVSRTGDRVYTPTSSPPPAAPKEQTSRKVSKIALRVISLTGTLVAAGCMIAAVGAWGGVLAPPLLVAGIVIMVVSVTTYSCSAIYYRGAPVSTHVRPAAPDTPDSTPEVPSVRNRYRGAPVSTHVRPAAPDTPDSTPEVSSVWSGQKTLTQFLQETVASTFRRPSTPRHFLQEIVTNSSGQTAALCRVSLFSNHPLLSQARAYLDAPATAPSPIDRAIGSLMGNAVGDAVGAPFEFLPWQENLYEGVLPSQAEGALTQKGGSFGLSPGEWTDDASMALCLADVLCLTPPSDHLDGAQTMSAFYHWWHHGYDNAFRNNPRTSVGLGGNISQALHLPDSQRHDPYSTAAGTRDTNGNGAAMRNSPIAIAARNERHAMVLAWEQSKVTHMGDQSALCCQFMAWFCYRAIHSETLSPQELKESLFQQTEQFGFSQDLFQNADGHLEQSIASVLSLVRNEKTELEDWRWKSADFKFNQERLRRQPGYIGSYVMDGLAMALHCVYTTDSFEAAVTKAVAHGGDADSVGAITAQLAGAIYGLQGIPKTWIDAVREHDGNGEIACRALVLARP